MDIPTKLKSRGSKKINRRSYDQVDNHSHAMTRIENCQKVCCTIRVFVCFLEPVAFILFYCSHRRICFTSGLLELASSVTGKQLVLCDNFIEKPRMLWKMPDENDIRGHSQVTIERLI